MERRFSAMIQRCGASQEDLEAVENLKARHHLTFTERTTMIQLAKEKSNNHSQKIKKQKSLK